MEISETQILGLLLALFMIYGIAEPLLSHRIPLVSVFFCVSAGVLVAKTSEKRKAVQSVNAA